MKEATIAVAGWVATDPKYVMGEDGKTPKLCTFRLAHTPRYFDRGLKDWKDQPTEWFTVRVFGARCANVANSVRTGQPVVVHGRLDTRSWTDNDGGARVDVRIAADAVGHDLTMGIAQFNRTITESSSADDSPEPPLPDEAPLDDADFEVNVDAEAADVERDVATVG